MLIDRLTALELAPSERTCRVHQIVEEDPETGAVLLRLLEGSVPVRQIYEALREEDVKIARDGLARHRRQQCACYR